LVSLNTPRELDYIFILNYVRLILVGISIFIIPILIFHSGGVFRQVLQRILLYGLLLLTLFVQLGDYLHSTLLPVQLAHVVKLRIVVFCHFGIFALDLLHCLYREMLAMLREFIGERLLQQVCRMRTT
jgi:hypothetical protein